MKLGEGGFGPVYKGSLVDGKEIAVKRLSQSSGQGPIEFKNEVLLIAKLQHQNLETVGLPSTLSNYLWDRQGTSLSASNSRLRIIHRDFKASNVLLDKEKNSNISDFSMARTFGGDQTEGVTRKVVGTNGYMAPEYAIDGKFSVKSDVYSFGIILLETVSGKRSRGCYDPVDNLSLIGHAWKLWKEGRSSELIDECFRDSCTLSEILLCIHVSLLCVQERPEDRPNISTVILMLGDICALPQLKRPGFFFGRYSSEADFSSCKNDTSSNL